MIIGEKHCIGGFLFVYLVSSTERCELSFFRVLIPPQCSVAHWLLKGVGPAPERDGRTALQSGVAPRFACGKKEGKQSLYKLRAR